MRRIDMARLACCLLVVPALAHAQDAAPAPPAAPTETEWTSAFAEQDNQFELGARFTSIDGDEARAQRYQDLRDGALFTNARFTRDSDAWLFKAAADNVGWRDQRYSALFERSGRFRVSGFWDQIPQFYSIDTKTPYTRDGSPLLLDNATQLAIQSKQATLSAYIPIAPQFDLRERRDTGGVRATIMPTTHLDLTAGFTNTRHSGELPWGASFGFGNDVEVPLPYNSHTNAVDGGIEWNTGRRMFRVAYDGSWFDNHKDELIWDNPLQLDDSATIPGRGRSAQWPSNSAQTVTAAGMARFAGRSQFTGAISYGFWNNDEPLQPFTINSALPQLALPRATAQAEAHVTSTTLNLVSRPVTHWSFNVRFRDYDYNNKTGHVEIPQFINYDTSVATSATGGPEPFAHSRQNTDADAIWTGLKALSFTLGYSYNRTGHEFRIFEHTNEHVFRAAADAVGTAWVNFHARYEYGDRQGTGLDEDLLTEIGEQPAMRHYDLANRKRHQFVGQVDFTPAGIWTFGVNSTYGKEDYDDSGFGLQKTSFYVAGATADVQLSKGFGAGVGYNREHYDGDQKSRNANPGQETDPTRDWTVNSKEDVDYVSFHFSTPRILRTEARVSYDYSFAEGQYFYTIVPGGPLVPPNQLPNVFNKLQQLHVDVRAQIERHLALTFAYLYEPFRVYDFAFDPTVINSIVQPSALVMGYVYRPYTTHSGVVGLKYTW